MFGQQLEVLVQILAEALHCGWAARWDTGGWIKWVPRVRNKIADSLCSEAMNVGRNLFYEDAVELTSNAATGNFVLSCDGGQRSVSQAAAAWCIHCFVHGREQPTLVAAGAVLLHHVSCFEAELLSLQE